MNAQTIWTHLIAAGLSPCGAAALMGNLRAESNLDPQNLQNSFEAKLNHTNATYTAAVDAGTYGNFICDGAGYGLAQWTYSTRKENLLLYARKIGASIGDLNMQIAFLLHELQNDYPGVLAVLKSTHDLYYASDLVLMQYERPADQGENQRRRRANYSHEYYKRFAKEGTTMATVSEQRATAVNLMTSREKKNDYTQGSKRKYFFGHPDNKPGNTKQKGFSDCSSAVRNAIKAATGIDIGGNTSAQINNRKKLGQVVHQTDGYYPDESVMEPADCLYFKGNKSHPLDVGHVEMYIGNGKICGHGSGTGPKIQNMKSYCKTRATSSRRYFMTIRWIKDGSAVEEPNVLKYGSEGEDVKILQMSLLALGFNLGSYGADGDFGSATQAAVISFQTNVGLEPTGIVDTQTLAIITAALEANGDTDEPDETLPMPVINGVTITEGTWHIRTGPGTEFASAGVVHGGEVLEKISIDNWIPVMFNGEVRFISPNSAKSR